VKKGTKCNYKLLQKFEGIRRKYVGLGIGGKVTGISGSLSYPSLFNIFKIMYQPNTCLVDIGAADGYVLIMALLYGYAFSSGIEYLNTPGLKHIFDTTWTTLKEQTGTGFLKQSWSRRQPELYYNANIKTFNRPLNSLGGNKNIHIFTFWDGFAHDDADVLMKKLKGQSKIKRGCFISRRSKRFGTFEKLQGELEEYKINVREIQSLSVAYGKERYNAIIVKFVSL
jgi:hypothetical protein